MSFLNKKKQKPKKAEVPDTLPSLPTDKTDDSSTNLPLLEPTAQQPPEPAQPVSTNPDPLSTPSSTSSSTSAPVEHPNPFETAAQAEQVAASLTADEVSRLYFGKLAKKIENGSSIEEIEHDLRSQDVISSITHNTEKNQKSDAKSLIEQEIKHLIEQMQELEKEWSELKLSIDSKKIRFTDLQTQIRSNSDIIKKKFYDLHQIERQN